MDYRTPSGKGGIDRRESYQFPQINPGNENKLKGNKKRKNGNYREVKINAKTLGSKVE